MKNIFTGIFLLVSACFMQAQTPNYYRNPDKIYLDSSKNHKFFIVDIYYDIKSQ